MPLNYRILKEMRADYNEIVSTVSEFFGHDWTALTVRNDAAQAFRNQLHEAMVRAICTYSDKVYIVNLQTDKSDKPGKNPRSHAKYLQVCVDPEKEVIDLDTVVDTNPTTTSSINRTPTSVAIATIPESSSQRRQVISTINTNTSTHSTNTANVNNNNTSMFDRIRFNIFG